VAREEIFGPVVVVIPFEEEDEGVEPANDSDYGVIDYVWSGDVARGLGADLPGGAATAGPRGRGQHRRPQRGGSAPFGGFKERGVGRDVGSYALHA
jgi:acyl-CoA reductase-like NAD-dependent aldehyde dehydrogenase